MWALVVVNKVTPVVQQLILEGLFSQFRGVPVDGTVFPLKSTLSILIPQGQHPDCGLAGHTHEGDWYFHNWIVNP